MSDKSKELLARLTYEYSNREWADIADRGEPWATEHAKSEGTTLSGERAESFAIANPVSSVLLPQGITGSAGYCFGMNLSYDRAGAHFVRVTSEAALKLGGHPPEWRFILENIAGQAALKEGVEYQVGQKGVRRFDVHREVLDIADEHFNNMGKINLAWTPVERKAIQLAVGLNQAAIAQTLALVDQGSISEVEIKFQELVVAAAGVHSTVRGEDETSVHNSKNCPVLVVLRSIIAYSWLSQIELALERQKDDEARKKVADMTVFFGKSYSTLIETFLICSAYQHNQNRLRKIFGRPERPEVLGERR